MGVLFSILTAICYSFFNVFSRKAAKRIPGSEAIFLTLSLNLLMFVPVFVVIKLLQGTEWPSWNVLGIYFISGIFGAFLGRWSLYNSIALLGPSRASLIKNSSPMFTIVLAALILNQKPGLFPLMGILIILLGLWLLSIEKREYEQNVHWRKGIFLAILAAMSLAFSDTIRALSMQIFPDLLVATAVSILGGWSAMIFFLIIKNREALNFHLKRKSLDRNLVIASIFSGIAQLTTFVAVSYLFAPYVSALVATAPVFTVILNSILSRGDERFNKYFWISMGLLLTGGTLIILFK